MAYSKVTAQSWGASHWTPKVIVLCCIPSDVTEAQIRLLIPRRIQDNLSELKLIVNCGDNPNSDSSTSLSSLLLVFRDEESEISFLTKEVGVNNGVFPIGELKPVLLHDSIDTLVQDMAKMLAEVEVNRIIAHMSDSSSLIFRSANSNFEQSKDHITHWFDEWTSSITLGLYTLDKEMPSDGELNLTDITTMGEASTLNGADGCGETAADSFQDCKTPHHEQMLHPPSFARSIGLQQNEEVEPCCDSTGLRVIYVVNTLYHQSSVVLRKVLEAEFGKLSFIRVFQCEVEMSGRGYDGLFYKETFMLPQGSCCIKFATVESELACLGRKRLRHAPQRLRRSDPGEMLFDLMSHRGVRSLEIEIRDEEKAMQLIQGRNDHSLPVERDAGIRKHHRQLMLNRHAMLELKAKIISPVSKKIRIDITDSTKDFVNSILQKYQSL